MYLPIAGVISLCKLSSPMESKSNLLEAWPDSVFGTENKDEYWF